MDFIFIKNNLLLIKNVLQYLMFIIYFFFIFCTISILIKFIFI